jgi:ribonuclease G
MLPMTDFGLMQITRQRVRENILQSVNEVCPYCLGTGLLTKKSHMIHEIEDWIKKYKNQNKEKKLILKVHPSLGAKLKEGIFSTILKLQSKYFVKIKLVEDNKISPQEFHFFSASTEKEITEIVK